MKNKMKSIAAIALFMTAGATASLAQEKGKEENHHVGEQGMGPHKGTIQEAEPNHLEILNKDGKVTFYLLDGDAKPKSNKGVTGTAIFQFADKTSATVALTPMGDDGFSVANDKASTFKTCVVTIKVDGKTATAKFKAENKVASTATKTYTCSMHPEVKSDKAGKCSKCGMDLIEKKDEHKHTEGDGHHH